MQETTQATAITVVAQPAAALRAMPFTCAALGLALLNFLQPGMHDEQRAFQILFLLAFAVLVAPGARAAALGTLATPQVRALLGGFFLLGCVSALAAYAPRYAFYEVASFFLLLVLGLCIAFEVAQDAAARSLWLLQALGIVCLVYMLRILTVYALALVTHSPTDALGLTPGFSNYRFFNHVQTVTLPLLVALFLLTPGTSRMRWAWFLLASFWWAMIGLTAARGTLLGELAGCAAILMLRRRQCMRFAQWMAATVLAGAALYLVLFVLLPALAGTGPIGEFSNVVGRTVANPASGRERLWRKSFELIAAYPWRGVGPLHFAHHAVDVRTGAHPHNWALQVAVEWGLPALACLVAAIAAGARGLVRAGRVNVAAGEQDQLLFAALAMTGVAILVDGLLSGLLVMPQSQLFIAIYLGCAIGWSTSMRPSATPARRVAGAARLIAPVLVAAAALCLAAVAWPELGARLRHEPLAKHAADINDTTTLWPRLWQDGYF